MEDDVFSDTVNEVLRVTSPGSRIMIIDNAVDRAAHVRSRTAEELRSAFKLSTMSVVRRVTVNKRENDHWLIDGCRV
jgi:hypothetical protein